MFNKKKTKFSIFSKYKNVAQKLWAITAVYINANKSGGRGRENNRQQSSVIERVGNGNVATAHRRKRAASARAKYVVYFQFESIREWFS